MKIKTGLTTCEDCGDSYSTVGWVSDECPFCRCSELEADRDLLRQEHLASLKSLNKWRLKELKD